MTASGSLSLMNRSLLLALARVSNKAILIVSPIILTRLLEVAAYGLYREFILYAMLLMGLSKFGIDRSLIYFVPKYPGREWVFVSQCIVFTTIAYVIGISLFGAVHFFTPITEGFAFPVELAFYVFFLMHLDFLESYWLGKKDSFRVLIYGCIRMVLRVGTVVAVAFFSGEVGAIILGLIAVESLRWTVVLVYLLRQRLVGCHVTGESVLEQWRFFLPLGSATFVRTLNKYAGQVITVAVLGPTALALYVLGSYLQMISHVVRSSVSDVIFPNMVEAEESKRNRSLNLWKRGSVVYAFFLVPAGMFLFMNADALVVVLFSSAYAGATPVFMVFSLVLLRDCVNFGVALRALNRPGVVLQGTLVALVVTGGMSFPLIWQYGLVGPAIALLLGKIAEEVYMGIRLVRITGVPIFAILPWGALVRLVIAAAVAVAAAEIATSAMAGGIVRTLVTCLVGGGYT